MKKNSTEQVYVHIGNLAAQTGVSRFTQTNSSWIYSKREDLTINSPEMLQYTHLLIEAKSKYSPNIKPYLKTHEILDSIDGFSHITLNYNMLPPIRIKTKPTIFIMKRKANIKYDPGKVKVSKQPIDLSQNSTIVDTKPNLTNNILESVEPILDDIVESLEEISKPLTLPEKSPINTELESESKETQPLIVSGELSDVSKNIKISTDLLNNISNNIDIESQEKEQEVETIVEPNLKDQSDTTDKKIIEKGLNYSKESLATNKMKPTNEVDSVDNISNIKETVKKIIQEKIQINNVKKDIANEREILDIVNKPVTKIKKQMKTKLEIIPKPKPPKKQNIKVKQVTINQVKDKETSINVKESIRKIINQFKEFEKDFAYEDSESSQQLSDLKDKKYSSETEGVIEEKHIDSLNTEHMNTHKVVKDPKESLKEIIDQFKHLKDELTSAEDDRFDEIAARYKDRPISETLMDFSEALKDLIQRKKRNKISATNLKKKKQTSAQINVPYTTLPADSVNKKLPAVVPEKDEKKQDKQIKLKVYQDSTIDISRINTNLNKDSNKNVRVNANAETVIPSNTVKLAVDLDRNQISAESANRKNNNDNS